MSKCADCKFYMASLTDLENNDLCLHPSAEFEKGGIRTEVETIHFRCFSMLDGFCKDHRLFEAKT